MFTLLVQKQSQIIEMKVILLYKYQAFKIYIEKTTLHDATRYERLEIGISCNIKPYNIEIMSYHRSSR